MGERPGSNPGLELFENRKKYFYPALILFKNRIIIWIIVFWVTTTRNLLSMENTPFILRVWYFPRIKLKMQHIGI
jgi:hypothetical protein